MCHLVVLATYVIAPWCHLEWQSQPTPSNPSTPTILKTPRIIIVNMTACMKDAKGNPWHMAMGIVICMAIAESVHIYSVPTMSNQMACVYNMAIKKMHKQRMHQQFREEWGLHQSWCKVLLHYAWLWKGIVSGREVQISLQMVINDIFNWLIGGGHYSSSKWDSWYAPWGNFYNLRLCRWQTKISLHWSWCHNHGHYRINSRSYSTICGDE